MQIVLDRFSTTSQAPTLLVLLPPAQASLADFVDHGFIDSVRSEGLHTDILLVNVGYADLMARTVATQINDQIVQASHSVAYREIWVSGISLGAFNALHFAAAYATKVTGLHLIAPYPGTRDILKEIESSGGPLAWARTPQSLQGDERAWWLWLCHQAQSEVARTPVFMSTGDQDRFLDGQRMLGGLLPVDQVNIEQGGHDWPTWKRLWDRWLTHGPLAKSALGMV